MNRERVKVEKDFSINFWSFFRGTEVPIIVKYHSVLTGNRLILKNIIRVSFITISKNL